MSKKTEFDCVAIFSGASIDGLRSRGPACLRLADTGERLIEKQVRLVRENWPKTNVFVMVRHDADKIIRAIGGDVNIIENQLTDSNDLEEIRLLMNVANPGSVLCLFGDMDTNDRMFKGLPNESFLMSTDVGMAENRLGLILNDGYVTSVDFGLPTTWSGVCGLRQHEIVQMRKFATRDKGKLFLHEGLNGILGAGAKLAVVRRESVVPFYFGSGHRTQRRNIHIIDTGKSGK